MIMSVCFMASLVMCRCGLIDASSEMFVLFRSFEATVIVAGVLGELVDAGLLVLWLPIDACLLRL